MRKIYFFSFIAFSFISCTNIRYVGQTYPATQRVDVFVTSASIQKSYDVIGKGYLAGIPTRNPENIQRVAMKKARETGADAVLITDAYLPASELTRINSTYTTDSIGRTAVTRGTTDVRSIPQTGFNILFIKYR